MAVNGGVVPLAGSLLGRKSVPNPQGAKCQKCLQVGHWTYECKNKRKYVHRSSRTSLLNKRLNQAQNEAQSIPSTNKTAPEGKKKKKKTSSGTGSSSSSSDSDSSDSSDDSSDSSDSSSSDSSSSSSSEDSDSSSNESSDTSSSSGSSSAQEKAKKKSKDKRSHSEKTKKHQDEEKEIKQDFHNKLKEQNLRSFLKPVESDEEYDRRKTNRDHWPNDQHKSKKHTDTQSPVMQHIIRKSGHDGHTGERYDNPPSYFEEYDRPSKHLKIINDSRERYERRKNSSVYWSKSGEEEEKKLQAENESAKQHEKKSEKKKKELDDRHSSKESRRPLEPDVSNDDYREKKNSYVQWSSERQEESNHSDEENNSKRFYENVEHGRRRHKERDSYYIELEEPKDESRMESIADNLEKKVSSSYWSYEMERMKKQTGDQSDPERSPGHSRKLGHKKKRHEVDEYPNEINGSKKHKAGSKVTSVHDWRDEKEKMKTESSHDRSPEKHKSRKDERKHHSKSKHHEEKKRKSDKHAGHASPEVVKPIDYDDFDLQGRNDFEPAVSPTYNVDDSVGEHHAKGHSKKSKHKEKKKNREFSLESSDGTSSDFRRGGRPPSPKRMKKLKSRSPERKREDKKSTHKHR